MTYTKEFGNYSHHHSHAVIDGMRACTGKPVVLSKVRASDYPPSCPKCAKLS